MIASCASWAAASWVRILTPRRRLWITTAARTASTASPVSRNHQVDQNGGLIVSEMEVSFSFQNPSLLAPRTLKT